MGDAQGSDKHGTCTWPSCAKVIIAGWGQVHGARQGVATTLCTAKRITLHVALLVAPPAYS